MATITRKDGQQFVIQAYRELLPKKKRSLLSQEIRLLAQQHGQYVHLYATDDDHFEVVLSHEVGYLLGESIWKYLSQPHNLIYCEAQPGSNQVLLIVVRQGRVYLDTQVLNHQLQAELAPLLSEKLAYQVVVSGDVSLAQAVGGGHFALPKALVASYKKLDAPLSTRLRLDPQQQLKPLAMALRSEHLVRKPTAILSVALVVVLGLCGWWIWSANQPAKSVVVVVPVVRTAVSLSAYERALMTPAPEAQIEELKVLVEYLYNVPGWQLDSVRLRAKQYRIQLSSDGAELEALEHWASARNFEWQLSNGGTQLLRSSKVTSRLMPEKMQPLKPLVAMLIDEIDQLLQAKSITLGQVQRHGKAQSIAMTIAITQISPEVLDLIGRELDDLPLSLQSVDINVQAGLLSGTIKLLVWGS